MSFGTRSLAHQLLALLNGTYLGTFALPSISAADCFPGIRPCVSRITAAETLESLTLLSETAVVGLPLMA